MENDSFEKKKLQFSENFHVCVLFIHTIVFKASLNGSRFLKWFYMVSFLK